MNITKEQFFAYVNVQMSGITNMWNVDLVSELSGLTREQCMEIIKTYEQLNDKYRENEET